MCVSRPCPKCGENRCSLHCACGRRGVARASAKVQACAGSAARTAAARRDAGTGHQQRRAGVVLPVLETQEAKFPVSVLGSSSFWDSVLEGVVAAKKTVFLGTFVYDNSKLQAKLVAALGRGVKVEILVDRVSLKEGVAPRAAGRLQKLKEKGAKVYTATGKSYRRVFGVDGRPGNYHAKAVVLDSLVAFVGSPNQTNNSLVNGELALRVSGAAVAAEVYKQAWSEGQSVQSLE